MADILFGNESILKNCQESKPLSESSDNLLVENVELLGYHDPLMQETLLVVDDEDDEETPGLDEEEIDVYPLSDDDVDSDEAISETEIEEEERILFAEKKSILPAHLNASLQNLERLGVFTRDFVNKDAPLSSQSSSEDHVSGLATRESLDHFSSKNPLILSPQKRTNTTAKLIAPVPINIKANPLGAPLLPPQKIPSRGPSPPANFALNSSNYYSTHSIISNSSTPMMTGPTSSPISPRSSSHLRTSQGNSVISGLPNIMSSPSPVSIHSVNTGGLATGSASPFHHHPSYSPLSSPFIYAPSPSLSPWYSPQAQVFSNQGSLPEANGNHHLKSSPSETPFFPSLSNQTAEASNNHSMPQPSVLVHPFVSRSDYLTIIHNKHKASSPEFVAFFHSLFSGSSNITYTPEMIDEIIQNNLSFSEISNKFFALEKIGEGTFSSVYKAKMVVDDIYFSKISQDRKSSISSSSGRSPSPFLFSSPDESKEKNIFSAQTSDNGAPESEFWKNDEFLALKRIHPTCHPNRILNEISHLKKLGGKRHVIPLISGLREKDQVTLVFPFFNHDKFKETLPFLSLSDIQQYMKALLISLNHVHSLKIIHRDVKPGNFLFQKKNEKFLLVDFGLAQMEENLESEKSVLLKRNFSENSSNFSEEQEQTQKKQKNETFSLLEISKNSTHSAENSHSNESSKNSTPLNSSKNSNHQDDVISQKKILSFHSSNFFIQQDPKNVSINSNSQLAEKNVSINSNLPSQQQQQPVSKNSFILSKKSLQAARAGTRGFRAPEVLMKLTNQTTAIDIWSCGVIFLSILSQRYPFFHSPDDLTSLAEITALIGTEKMKEAAIKIGKKFEFSVNFPGENLKHLCTRLGKREMIPDSAYDLLEKLLDPNPLTRISAEEALKHGFFQEKNETKKPENFTENSNFYGNVFYQ